MRSELPPNGRILIRAELQGRQAGAPKGVPTDIEYALILPTASKHAILWDQVLWK